MAKLKKKVIIHPAASRRLASLFRKIKTIRGVAREIKVNPFFVHQNLIKGIEPPDTTIKYQEVRVKLFLSRKKKIIREKSDKPKLNKPDYIVWWNHLPTEERHKVIMEYKKWKNKS